ncbi:MAG: FxsA family protein [Gammaproteobacteria bacterium]
MRAFPLLLLALFFAVPLIEIYLLIKVGGWIGALPTVFMVVFTAVLGVLLLRQQGLATLQRVQATMARGQVPALELLEAMLLTFGGALLLVPGFFTDALGFLCLVPPFRRWLIRSLFDRYFLARQWPRPPGGPPGTPPGEGPVTLEGEYKRED